MSLDAIKQVTGSEQQARDARAQAQADATDLLAQARHSAQAAQAEKRHSAQERAREMLLQAEEQAEKERAKTLAEFDADCQALKDRAGEKMDEAASLIVRRVVEN